MSDLELLDNSGSGEDQGSDNNNQSWEELARLQAQLSASSNESRLMNEVSKVLISDDFSYFQDLNWKDKVMAERVIEKVAKLKWLDVNDVRKLLVKETRNQIDPSDIERTVKETIARQEGEKALEEFIGKIGLSKDKDLNEEFMSNFEEYMQGKDFNAANVKKFAKSAYRDLNEDKVKAFETKRWEIDAQIKSGGDSKDTKAKKEGRQLLNSTRQNDW